MTTSDDDPILDRYRSHAADLGARFQSLSPDEVYAPVEGYLPTQPMAVLDIGAGSGRDALWLAGQGHRVTAVEPVEELSQQAAGLEGAEAVTWITDTLPDLAALNDRPAAFDLILLAGVWHHVPDAQRAVALGALARLLRPGGHVLMSLRQGPGEDDQMIFACDPDRTVVQGTAVGLMLSDRVAAQSVQTGNQMAGVTWTWLVFQHSQEANR